MANTLYKYRNCKDVHDKEVLSKNQLYFSSPKYFNDPYDCRLTVDFSKLNENNKEEYIREIAIKYFYELEKRGNNIENAMIFLEKKLRNIDAFQKYYNNILFDNQNRLYGIISLTYNNWWNMLMWAHYSDNHKGYCIGFDEKELIKYGLENKHEAIKGGIVKYEKEYTLIDPFDDLRLDPIEQAFLTTHTKSKDWVYEDEYRITKLFKKDTNQNRILEIPESSIKEVIIGQSISPVDESEITEICKLRNIPIFKIYADTKQYRLRRKQVY